jgi:phage terminase small subunit
MPKIVFDDYNLDRRKIQLVQLIIEGRTKTDIAKLIGISRDTVYEWLKDPNVQKLIKEGQQDLVDSGQNYLINRFKLYLDELDKVALTSEDARTKNSALQYLIDRVAGKVPTRIEAAPKQQEDSISDDMLDQAIADAKACSSNDSDNNSNDDEQ